MQYPVWEQFDLYGYVTAIFYYVHFILIFNDIPVRSVFTILKPSLCSKFNNIS